MPDSRPRTHYLGSMGKSHHVEIEIQVDEEKVLQKEREKNTGMETKIKLR